MSEVATLNDLARTYGGSEDMARAMDTRPTDRQAHPQEREFTLDGLGVCIKGGNPAAVKEARAGLECNGVPIYATGVPETIEVTIEPEAQDDQSIKWPERDRGSRG